MAPVPIRVAVTVSPDAPVAPMNEALSMAANGRCRWRRLFEPLDESTDRSPVHALKVPHMKRSADAADAVVDFGLRTDTLA